MKSFPKIAIHAKFVKMNFQIISKNATEPFVKKSDTFKNNPQVFLTVSK
jgi:hypothetical protein